jgi:hypothetical protein
MYFRPTDPNFFTIFFTPNALILPEANFYPLPIWTAEIFLCGGSVDIFWDDPLQSTDSNVLTISFLFTF